MGSHSRHLKLCQEPTEQSDRKGRRWRGEGTARSALIARRNRSTSSSSLALLTQKWNGAIKAMFWTHFTLTQEDSTALPLLYPDDTVERESQPALATKHPHEILSLLQRTMPCSQVVKSHPWRKPGSPISLHEALFMGEKIQMRLGVSAKSVLLSPWGFDIITAVFHDRNRVTGLQLALRVECIFFSSLYVHSFLQTASWQCTEYGLRLLVKIWTKHYCPMVSNLPVFFFGADHEWHLVFILGVLHFHI